MKSIVFRVRREYFDAIKRGEKKVEYRKYSAYWLKRLDFMSTKFRYGPNEGRVAVFICGRMVHRRNIDFVRHMLTPQDFSEQGKKDIPTETCFAIHLGEEVAVNRS